VYSLIIAKKNEFTRAVPAINFIKKNLSDCGYAGNLNCQGKGGTIGPGGYPVSGGKALKRTASH